MYRGDNSQCIQISNFYVVCLKLICYMTIIPQLKILNMDYPTFRWTKLLNAFYLYVHYILNLETNTWGAWALDQTDLGLQSWSGRLLRRDVCMRAQSLSRVHPFVTPWTSTRQAPLSKGFPGKNTGVGCHVLLQGIFPTQESNRHLLLGKWILYHWATSPLAVMTLDLGALLPQL